MAGSRQKMIEAATALLDDGGDLTVASVTRAAEVTRPTYYQHFEDMAALIQEAALQRISLVLGEPRGLRANEPSLREHVRRILAELHNHTRFYLRAVHGPGCFGLLQAVIDFVTRYLLSVDDVRGIIERSAGRENDARAHFIAAGAVWFVVDWLAREEEDTNPHEGLDITARQIITLIASSSGASEGEINALLS